MITILLKSYKNLTFTKNFTICLLLLLIIAGTTNVALAQTTLPAETVVCEGTANVTLVATAEHPKKDLLVQWQQKLQNGTWADISIPAGNTSSTSENGQRVTTTKLVVTNYTHGQEYRVAFGVSNADPTSTSTKYITIVVPSAAITFPGSDVYTGEPAVYSFAGQASANAKFEWSFAPNASFAAGSNANSENPVVIWSTPGEKTITLVVNNGNGTCIVSTSKTVKIYGDYTWTGTESADWFNANNWSGKAVPGNKDNAVIVAAPFMPELSANTTLKNLTVQSGNLNLGTASLTVTGNTNLNGGSVLGGTLILHGNLATNSATAYALNHAVFAGANEQTITNSGAAGLTFRNLIIAKEAAQVKLETGIVVNGTLDLQNTNRLQLGNADLQMGAAGQINAGANGYVVTNGLGTLQMLVNNNNTEVFFPVGNHSYNPVKIKLTTASTADIFKVRVQGGLFDLYGTNNIGVEPPVEDGISRTWVIEEGVKGGSDAQVSLQFSSDKYDWMPAFSLDKAVFAQYIDSWSTAPNGKPLPVVNNSNMLQVSQSNITSFRLFGIINNDHQGLTTLPVELLSFKATRVNGPVELKWSTAMEKNNDYFTIEQSQDGKSFTKVAQIKGAGNSSRKLDYSYSHASAPARLTYYRLKQTDFDGTVSYSKIVAVNSLAGGLAVKAYPNPSTGIFTLTGVDNITDATVLDATGRTVKKLTALTNNDKVDLTEQQAGVYFLQLQAGTEVKTVRLIKK